MKHKALRAKQTHEAKEEMRFLGMQANRVQILNQTLNQEFKPYFAHCLFIELRKHHI